MQNCTELHTFFIVVFTFMYFYKNLTNCLFCSSNLWIHSCGIVSTGMQDYHIALRDFLLKRSMLMTENINILIKLVNMYILNHGHVSIFFRRNSESCLYRNLKKKMLKLLVLCSYSKNIPGMSSWTLWRHWINKKSQWKY